MCAQVFELIFMYSLGTLSRLRMMNVMVIIAVRRIVQIMAEFEHVQVMFISVFFYCFYMISYGFLKIGKIIQKYLESGRAKLC